VALLPDLSVQLYSVRAPLGADFFGTLGRLREIGFTRVEPFGLLDHADKLRNGLAGNGLAAPTTHQSLAGGDLDRIFSLAADLGIGTVIHPVTPRGDWTTRSDVERVVELLNAAADVASRYGVRVGYHNHVWEMRLQLEGRASLEVLADLVDPSVVLEVDTYWAAVGGQDVPALLGRLGSKVTALHLKDGPLTGENEDQLPWGSGDLPAAQIIAAATALEFPVIEFDRYSADIFDGIAAAYAYATGTLGFPR
jgi:sugar phosphate isomerase/epimerase